MMSKVADTFWALTVYHSFRQECHMCYLMVLWGQYSYGPHVAFEEIEA